MYYRKEVGRGRRERERERERTSYSVQSMVEHDNFSSPLCPFPNEDISRMWIAVDETSQKDHLTVHLTKLQSNL